MPAISSGLGPESDADSHVPASHRQCGEFLRSNELVNHYSNRPVAGLTYSCSGQYSYGLILQPQSTLLPFESQGVGLQQMGSSRRVYDWFARHGLRHREMYRAAQTGFDYRPDL